MRVLKINDLPEKAIATATPIDGWTGGAVSRTRQEIVGDGQSENFRCNVVNFRVGATTGWHVHALRFTRRMSSVSRGTFPGLQWHIQGQPAGWRGDVAARIIY